MSCHPNLGCPPQNDHPNPIPQPEGPTLAPPAEFQSVDQPDLSNPAPHQVPPYTGKHRINV